MSRRLAVGGAVAVAAGLFGVVELGVGIPTHPPKTTGW